MAERLYSDTELYRRLLAQARPYWRKIAAVLLLDLLGAPLHLLLPLPVKIIVDSVIGNHPLPALLARILPESVKHSETALLALVSSLFVVVTLLVYTQGLTAWLLQTYTGQKLAVDLRARLFHHLQRLSLRYHDSKGTADSTYRIENDAASIQAIVIGGITPFLTDASMLAATFYVAARIDWQLALVALGISPVLSLLARSCRARLSATWPVVKELDSAAMGVVQEVLSSARVVKAFGRENHEQQRFLTHSNRRMRGELKLAWTEGGFDLLVAVTLATGTALTMFLGVVHIRAGILTLGQLLMIVAYLAELYEPLTSVSKRLGELQASLASADRVFAVLDIPTEVEQKPDCRPLRRARGAVEFRNVWFAYDGSRPVLQDVTFALDPGTRAGIVGATGSGKSTLLSLLLRFYDPDRGEILVDGVDIREYKIAELRNQFGIVLQDSVLFSTSIAENIAYGRPNASEAEIIEASKAAGAHEFIRQLPEGYATQAGERGLSLSGGERQRIAIARAFLKDAPILLLDEPTSSIDTRTEAAILDAMERLMRGRTTLTIAHRLHTIDAYDVRLEMRSGRLASAESAAGREI